ncbi:MAG: plastocyanin/azurin family copper-binding protein, partial [Candidatus Spechtbacterales bacterium]
KQVLKFVIEGDEFSFLPQNITVPRGATVELTFKNIGRVPHNYIIDELGIATKTIGGGKTDVVTFTAPNTPGVIDYASYCSIPGHREAGMEGTIEIK